MGGGPWINHLVTPTSPAVLKHRKILYIRLKLWTDFEKETTTIIDWLIDWLIDCLLAWLLACLLACLLDWLIDFILSKPKPRKRVLMLELRYQWFQSSINHRRLLYINFCQRVKHGEWEIPNCRNKRPQAPRFQHLRFKFHSSNRVAAVRLPISKQWVHLADTHQACTH